MREGFLVSVTIHPGGVDTVLESNVGHFMIYSNVSSMVGFGCCESVRIVPIVSSWYRLLRAASLDWTSSGLVGSFSFAKTLHR
jgi:hypothetical protein